MDVNGIDQSINCINRIKNGINVSLKTQKNLDGLSYQL